MAENAPQDHLQNEQLRNELQQLGPRRYTTADRIDQIAKDYYQKTGNGITFSHLIMEGIAKSKPHAQNTLKRFRSRDILFTLGNRRPQIYFPTSKKSDIMQSRLKSAPINPTGVNLHKKYNCNVEDIVNQSLVGYVLPLLPAVPLSIHNLHFKLLIKSECYDELSQKTYNRNGGKCSEQIISGYLVKIVIYRSGRTVIEISSSENPFRLYTDIDLARLFAFIGEIKSFLKDILRDSHERLVPDVMEWQMTECDINKDIVINDTFHLTGLKIQLKHFNHLLRIYFKAMGKDTVCRVEKNILPKEPVIKTINRIFEFNDKFNKGGINSDEAEMKGE